MLTRLLGPAAAAALMLCAGPALAQPMPVKWVTMFDSQFKGHPNVVIPAYHVNFITSQQATAVATIGARSRLAMVLAGVDEATMRKLTDAAYADLKAQFTAAGIGVVSEADAQALVAATGLERIPGNMATAGGGPGVTIGKSLRRGFVTFGATDAPALNAYRLAEAQAGLGAAMANASAVSNSAKFAKPAWPLNANVLIPSLTINFAEMEASTGSGMFGATANASGAVKFMIDLDSPTITLNPVMDGRSANPGGLRPAKNVVWGTPFATVEKGGAQVRSMGTWTDENYQTVARARGDAVVVDLPVWEGLVRDAYRSYNAALVAAVVKVVKK